MFANILFDLDGTLSDPQKGITGSIRFALKQLGRPAPPPEALLWCIGPPLRESFPQLLDTEDEALVENAIRYYRKRFANGGLFENTLYPQTSHCLSTLKGSGFRIYLATAKPIVFARRIIDHFELQSYFNGLYGSELDGRRSRKGELIAHLLQQEALDPGACLMVGDRLHDVQGGRENGVPTAAVTYGYGSLDELRQARPNWIFDSLEGLTAFLMGKPAPTPAAE